MDKQIIRIQLILWYCIILSQVAVALELQISHQRGFYKQAFELTIETNEPNTKVRYTINGDKPFFNTGLLYTKPILINTTTSLQVLAYNLTDTVETTHTYIYLNKILSAPYMSEHIVKNKKYTPLLNSSFYAIASMAVTIPNKIKVGDDIELEQLPASVEMFFSDGSTTGFSSPCGIKTWGGSPSNPKKNYRLLFKKIFGSAKLKFDVFDDGYEYPIEPVDEFDNLLLRAGSQDGLNAEYNNEANAQFIRNRFVCDLAMEMGYPAPHGRFVHLFLNGAYAGHYHLMERPDEHFFQSYIFPSIAEESIEVKKNDTYWNMPNVNPTFYETLLSYSNGLSAQLNYEKLHDFINIDAAADYITFHQFIGNIDWHDQQNTLLGAIPIKGAGPFEFVVWDVDFSLGNKGVFSIGYEFNKHGAVPENLFNAKEFKFLQGDKVECLCNNKGILTPNNLKEKYLYRARQVEVSLIAEAARWGNNDYSFGGNFPDHKPVENWEVNTHWKAEFNSVYHDFLTNRTEAFIQKYIDLERYTELKAVETNLTNNGIKLTNHNGNGTVVYMLNGEDPRAFAGLLNPNAIQYNNKPIEFNEPVELKARFYKNTSTGRKWSPMCPQKFYPNQKYQNLVINELHIQPNDLVVENDTISAKHFEFIEIKNTGNETIFLQDVAFDDGVTCTFKKHTQIAPQGYVVIAADSLFFIEKYGFSPNATYTGKLNNSGETLRLTDPYGKIIDSLSFKSTSPWPLLDELTDHSIALKESNLNNSQGKNWDIQSIKFTPGKANQFCDKIMDIAATVSAVSCFGNTDGFIIPNISGGSPPYQLKWNSGSTNLQLNNLAVGNYTLTVTDKNNCTASKTFEIKQATELRVFITQNNNTVKATVSGGEPPYQYQWSNGETGSTLQNVNGTLKVTVRDRNLCKATAQINLQNESLCFTPNNIRTVNVQPKSASLTWDEKPNDLGYFIQYKKLSEGEHTLVKLISNNVALNNLEPCTTYQINLVTLCKNDENSNFSSSFYFKTSGCSSCPTPQNLVPLNFTSSSVSITWNLVPDADYILYYKSKGANSWHTFETWMNFAILFNLDACKNYEWKVATKCSRENLSTHSDVSQFKTSGCKLNNDALIEQKDWAVFPNPVMKKLHINLSKLSLKDAFVKIEIYDAFGKLHIVKNEWVDTSQTSYKSIILNVETLSSGFYYLNLFNDDMQLSKKIQVYGE